MGKVTRKPRAAKASCEAKILRQVRLVQAAGPGQEWAAVEITVGKERALYGIKPIKTDFGQRAFEVVKSGEVDYGERGYYSVLLDGENSTCDCRGWLRHGHCKHCWACQKLADRNLI